MHLTTLNIISGLPETARKASPESLKDTLTLLENTKACSLNNSDNNSSKIDIQYSALRQDDNDGDIQANGKVGQEIFDNLQFDYDDFSEEDDELNLIEDR